MRINQNIAALNAWRNLTRTDEALNKSLERLSSGVRINRAADDAAGLAISEKMRAQIRGINQAQRNAQDAISLIQTAEGAMNESHGILQRMRELAVQAASDTLTTSDRQEIQKELDQLTSEIDRIATTTEFNTKKLLNGGAGTIVTATNANVGSLEASGDTVAGTYALSAATRATTASDVTTATFTDTTTALGGTGGSITISGETFNFTATNTVQDVLDAVNAKTNVTGVQAAFTAGAGITFATLSVGSSAKFSASSTGALAGVTDATGADAQVTLAGATTYSASGNRVTVTSGPAKGLSFDLKVAAAVDITVGASNALTLQIGANKDQTVSVSINSVTTTSIGVSGLNVATKDNAAAALATIDAAVTKVSSERSKIGAVQNRLEYTIANLGTASENMTAAESRIRDVDMAQEMAKFTRSQILMQAGTAMMAQANMKPQSVLQLLR
ncbi:MAG: flagellin N-terminal helical domain-containing protein [Bacillota bacterium]